MELKKLDHNLEQMDFPYCHDHSHNHHHLHHHEYAQPSDHHPPPETPPYQPPSFHFNYNITNIITMPAICCTCTHQSSQQRVDHCYFATQPSVEVYCKADPSYNLTIKHGKVVLAPSDPSDEYQKWYKDEKFSTSMQDEAGFPCFSLVNKATGHVLKRSIGATHPVQLVPFKQDRDNLDESILWTEFNEVSHGFKAIRMVNNIRLILDAFRGDKNSGGIHNGTTIGLWEWNNGDNQIWKIVPYCN